MLAAGLAVAVVGLALRTARTPAPGVTAPTEAGPRVERLAESEETLRKLSYAAWVYRWRGGVLGGELRAGPAGPAVDLDAGRLLADLRSACRTSGKADPVPADVSGTLVVLAGPVPTGERPKFVPCRVVYQGESAAGERVTREYQLQVPYAAPASEDAMSVQVFGGLQDLPSGSFGPDPGSRYTLVRLRWLP
jgi:hypothetical protein